MPSCVAKQAVLPSKTACFGRQNGTNRNTLNIKTLKVAHKINTVNREMLTQKSKIGYPQS